MTTLARSVLLAAALLSSAGSQDPDVCIPGAATFDRCLTELAEIGLPMFGNTWHLVRNCGDENPLLDLISSPQRLPAGRNRYLLAERRKDLASFDMIEEVLLAIQRYATDILQLASGYSHSCFLTGHCSGQRVLGEGLDKAQNRYLGMAAALVQNAANLAEKRRLPWNAGLRDPAAAIARHAFDAKHLDFTKSLVTGLLGETLEPTHAMGHLHDLVLRVATANCELQAELLAEATLVDLLSPQLIDKLSFARLPRFEFNAGSCCRRYQALKVLLETMVSQDLSDRGPFRILEIGVNNAITSEYLLKKFPDLEFDGIDPHIDADDILEEASSRLKPFGSRARLWRKTSEAAAPMFPAGTFDFVFIDGDHSREAVAVDLRIWREKVRPGGILAGHDLFNLAFEGVLEALLEDLAPRDDSGSEASTVVHYAPDFVWWLQL